MLNKALRVGQLIANAHPTDVRLLFKKYGIAVEPTGKTIMDAYLVYGKPFLFELLDIAWNKRKVSAATGDYSLETDKLTAYAANKYETATTAAAKEKASTYEGVLKWLDGGAAILTTVGGAWNTLSAILSGKKVDTGTSNDASALEAEFLKAKLEAQQAQDSSSTKTYLLIGAGILVAVLVLIMFLKHKK